MVEFWIMNFMDNNDSKLNKDDKIIGFRWVKEW